MPGRASGIERKKRTAPGWNPKDGPAHRDNDKRRPLDEVLEVIAKGDPDQEAYWRWMYAANHPDPAPFTRCRMCACVRTITAYQRIGWLGANKAAPKPTPVPSSFRAAAAQVRERGGSIAPTDRRGTD